MITCVNYDNLHEFGKIFKSQFQLRYNGFIERQDYDVSVYKDMEFDQYDKPCASYLIYHDNNGNALGVNRLTPTTHGSMLEDLWPNYVDDKSNFNNSLIWEGTRYCISKDIAPDLRQRIVNEMAIAYLEFGLDLGLSKIIGLMPTYIYRSVFERPGIVMEYLGDIQNIDGHKVRAVAIPINQTQLNNVRVKTGINERILRYSEITEERHGKAA
jgi:acyl homoserine lactone synthase